MGKRFEGEEPNFMEILTAYTMLGMSECLGQPGEATAYTMRYPMSEIIELSILPGQFSAQEISDLRTWAQ